MRLFSFLGILFFAICFSIAASIEPWYQSWQEGRSANVLSLLLGDSRRLFANHFFAKADAYFHSGYYPTIFDRPHSEEKSHMVKSTESGHGQDHHEGENEQEEEHGFLGRPTDWIDAFGRHFFPSEHTHMGKAVDEREILPWLRLTAELDPHKVDTYVVASYTLRKHLKKADEAEQFLREGLRANPDSYEILFELGRIRDEERNDPAGARNLWELALRKWQKQAVADAHPDELTLAQILGLLGQLEERQGHWDTAIKYFEALETISPAKEELRKRIAELKAKKGSN